jgi:RNA polymerase sigma factor (sigma-70 family)
MTGPSPEPGKLVPLPSKGAAPDVVLEALDLVYAFIYARVGNRPDAEDLTQQVALKAIPRLRADAVPASVRAYLMVTARTVLATFWSTRLGLPEAELHDEIWVEEKRNDPSPDAAGEVERILAKLSPNYRRILELRFLRGYSLREIAAEVGSTVGAVKVMQLRALRAAGKVSSDG